MRGNVSVRERRGNVYDDHHKGDDEGSMMNAQNLYEWSYTEIMGIMVKYQKVLMDISDFRKGR